MNTREIVELFFRFLEIATNWPIILLVIVFLFRKEFQKLIPELSKRLTKASLGNNSFEFDRPVKEAFNKTIDFAAKEFQGRPEELTNYLKNITNKFLESNISSKPLSQRSILWVDDNPKNNIYESNLLQQLGAIIENALSTQEAISILEKNKNYDLIISDIHRIESGKSNPNAGYDLLDRLRKNPNYKRPLIFYTGNLNHIDHKRAGMAYGVADSSKVLTDLVINALLNG